MRTVGLRIGELAGRLDLNTKTIRYYEDVGLLPPARRSPAGYRLYDADDERRLRFIASARRAGFSLGEIREMLALRDRGESPCRLVRSAIERRERDLQRQIADLVRLRKELGTLARRARRLGSKPPSVDAYCHILER
ncbi:MAG: heavy metal-responsive transcriptional regulator [Gaiellaceae bacterium]